jgi:hypothetical protein
MFTASLLLGWCFDSITKNFDLSPHRPPSSANHLTPTSHHIRPPNPLGYIVDEGETKYQGEKSLATSSGWKLFNWLTFTSQIFVLTRGRILHISHSHNKPLLTHRSPRIHYIREGNQIWRWDVDLIYKFAWFLLYSPLLPPCLGFFRFLMHCGMLTLKPKWIVNTTINRRRENAVFEIKHNQQMHATTLFWHNKYKLMKYQQFVGQTNTTINLMRE